MLPISLAAFFDVVNVSTTLKQGFWCIACLQLLYIIYRKGDSLLLKNKYLPYIALLMAAIAVSLVRVDPRVDHAFIRGDWRNIIYPFNFFLGYFLISDSSSRYALFRPFKALKLYDEEPENRFALFIFLLFIAVNVDLIYGFVNYRPENMMVYGFHEHGTTLGPLIVPIVTLEFCALFLKLYRSKREFVFILSSALLGTAGIVATTSRISILALLFSIVCLSVYKYRFKGIVITLGAVILLSLAILGALKFAPLHPRIYEKAAEIHNFTDPRTSTGWRFVLWKEAVRVFKEHPFMGVGHRQLTPYLEALPGQYMASGHSHTTALQILAEHGLLGFLLTSALALKLLWIHISAALKRNPYGVMGVLLFMVVVIEGITDFAPIKPLTVLLWLLNGALVRLEEI